VGKVRAEGRISAEKCRKLVQIGETLLISPENSPRC